MTPNRMADKMWKKYRKLDIEIGKINEKSLLDHVKIASKSFQNSKISPRMADKMLKKCRKLAMEIRKINEKSRLEHVKIASKSSQNAKI